MDNIPMKTFTVLLATMSLKYLGYVLKPQGVYPY
jgi:hypothetical protein